MTASIASIGSRRSLPARKTRVSRASSSPTSPRQSARQLIGYEVAGDALQTKVVSDALGATPEQAKIAVIYVEGLFSGDDSAKDGEVDYDEIVFAPNDNQDTAVDLDPNDPAWAAAKTEADDIYAQLQAITDIDARKTKFTEIATDNSDDATSQDGGAVGFVTKDEPADGDQRRAVDRRAHQGRADRSDQGRRRLLRPVLQREARLARGSRSAGQGRAGAARRRLRRAGQAVLGRS